MSGAEVGWVARLLDAFLRVVLPDGFRSRSIRGDLRQEHRSRGGGVEATLWYAFQAGSVALWSWVDRVRGEPWDEPAGEAAPRFPEARGGPELRRVWADGFRVFHRSPGYAATVVATLGLALATTVTVFTLVRGVLLRDLPYPEPDRLVRIDRLYSDGQPNDGGVAYPDLLDWREQISSLQGIAGHVGYEGIYPGEGIAEIWSGRAVTPNLLEVLGVDPYLGPGFVGADRATGSSAILLSHDLWERRFGAAADIVGGVIDLDGRSWTVVGVLPRGFAYPEPGQDFLVPMQANSFLDNRGAGLLQTVARLAPEVSLEAAQADVDAVVSAIDQEFGEWRDGVVVRRYGQVQVESVRSALWMFLGAVALVLLVACANITGLALARTEARRSELAIRMSLGAGSGRIVRALLAESVTLALVGGALGVLGALAGLETVLASAPADLPRRGDIRVDLTVLAFGAVTAVVVGTLCGWLPAVRGARSADPQGLRAGRTRLRGAARTQELLAAAQLAVAVALMAGGGLLVRSFAALTSVDPGFRMEGSAVIELGLGSDAYPDREAILAFHDRLMEGARAIPSVSSVGLSTHLPFSPSSIRATVVREGEVYRPGEGVQFGLEMYNGDYPVAMGLGPVQGRWPSGEGVREVVVNASAAAAMWRGEDAIGKRFSFDVEEGQPAAPESFFTVVGVVPDVLTESLDQEPRPAAYYALPDFSRHYGFISGRFFYLTVGSDLERPAELVPALRQAVAEVDPTLPVRSAGALEDWVRATTVASRFRTLTMGVFSLLAVAVAMVGVYGVMAYGVSRGLPEIGVRMALGASAGRVRSRVLVRAAGVVVVGIGLGLAGAVVLGPMLDRILYQVSGRDPVTLGMVAVVAALGSLLAAYVPAARASRVDPAAVLRDD